MGLIEIGREQGHEKSIIKINFLKKKLGQIKYMCCSKKKYTFIVFVMLGFYVELIITYSCYLIYKLEISSAGVYSLL